MSKLSLHTIIGIAWGIQATCAVPEVAAAEPPQLIIRATSPVPNPVTEYVAKVSKPRKVTIPPTQSVEYFIRQRCGSYSPVFANTFYSLNEPLDKDRGPSKSPRDANMPACIIWGLFRQEKNSRGGVGIPVPVLSTDKSLDPVLRRNVGLKVSADTIWSCAQAVTISAYCGKTYRQLVEQLNPPGTLDKFFDPQQQAQQPQERQLVLPLVTKPSHLELDPNAKDVAEKTLQDVKRKIEQLSEPYGAEYESAIFDGRIHLFGAADLQTEKDKKGCRGAIVERPDWPYDANRVSSVINRTLERLDAPTPVTVTVMDTGLDDGQFIGDEKKFLRTDTVSGSPYGTYGMGIDDTKVTKPAADYPLAWHGTAVADVLAGGSGLRGQFKELFKYLKINVINLITSDRNTNPPKFDIVPEAIVRSMDFTDVNRVAVANVSIGSTTSLDQLEKLLQSQNLILVAAAGNEAQNVQRGEFTTYPASYGGTHNWQIITVAAHDGNNAIADFSNYSNKYVDLVAPGCAIPNKIKLRPADGTSFAAPLVSMTVALLRAFNVEPRHIKMRLQATVDFDPKLEQVLWSGRLNIVKALALYDDVLERRSQAGQPRLGEWVPSDQRVQLCEVGDEYPVSWIKKIIVDQTIVNGAPDYKIRIVRLEKQLTRGEKPELTMDPACKPAERGIIFKFKDPPEPDAIEVPWSDIVDLVPRYFLDNQDNKLGGEGPPKE